MSQDNIEDIDANQSSVLNSANSTSLGPFIRNKKKGKGLRLSTADKQGVKIHTRAGANLILKSDQIKRINYNMNIMP